MRRAPDETERFADAWRYVVTEREESQSDVNTIGRGSDKQSIPPRRDAAGLVCVGCGADEVQARNMTMCSKCEAFVCYPGCTMRCARCDVVTCERCACRCAEDVALGAGGGDREQPDPDDDDSDSGGESWGSNGWYRGMPENSGRKSYQETCDELRKMARRVLLEVMERAIAGKAHGGDHREVIDLARRALNCHLQLEANRSDDGEERMNESDGTSEEGCLPCRRYFDTATGKTGAREHPRPELQAGPEALTCGSPAAQPQQPEGGWCESRKAGSDGALAPMRVDALSFDGRTPSIGGTGRGEVDDGYCGGSEDGRLRHSGWHSDPSRRKFWRRAQRALDDVHLQWSACMGRSARRRKKPTTRSPKSTGGSPERDDAEADSPSLDRVGARRGGREVNVGGSRVQISDDGDFQRRIKEAANGTDVSTVDESSPAPTDEGCPILFGYDAQTALRLATLVGPELSAVRCARPDGDSRSVDVMESCGARKKVSFYDYESWGALGMTRSMRIEGGTVAQVDVDPVDQWNALEMIRSIRNGGGTVAQVDAAPVDVCGGDGHDAMVHREDDDRGHLPQDVMTCADRSGASPIGARTLDRTKLDGDENGEPRCRRRRVTGVPRPSDDLEPCARLCDLSGDGTPDIPMSGGDDDRGDGAALTGRRRSCAAGTAKDVAGWVLRRLLPACGGQCTQLHGGGDASWATGRIGMIRLVFFQRDQRVHLSCRRARFFDCLARSAFIAG